MSKEELSVLEKEKKELAELQQRVAEFEEIQKVRAEKEKLRVKIKELNRKPSVFDGWLKRTATDDDPFGLKNMK